MLRFLLRWIWAAIFFYTFYLFIFQELEIYGWSFAEVSKVVQDWIGDLVKKAAQEKLDETLESVPENGANIFK